MREIERVCISCYKTFNRDKLIKMKIIEGNLIINPSGYLVGRSYYLCYNVECINKLKKSKKLEKTLKNKVKLSPDFWDVIQKEVSLYEQ